MWLSNIVKCSEKCTRRNWSERVHYISMKHAPYVTRVQCWNIVHAATSSVRARAIHDKFYKEIKKFVPQALLSSISTWEFLRTLEKSEKHSSLARTSPHFSRVLKNSRMLTELNNALSAFQFFNIFSYCYCFALGLESYNSRLALEIFLWSPLLPVNWKPIF